MGSHNLMCNHHREMEIFSSSKTSLKNSVSQKEQPQRGQRGMNEMDDDADQMIYHCFG